MQLRWQALLAVALAIAPAVALADEAETGATVNRAVIDQIELEPSILTGQRLRVTVTATTLTGQRLDLTEPKAIKAYAGSSEIKAPYVLGTYGATGSDTAIVILVQSSLDYTDVLPAIADAFDTVVFDKLPDRTQVAVMSFGESIGVASKLGTPKSALAKLREITSDGSTGEPVLLDTLERALPLLKKAKTDPPGRPLRKMILLLSDGRDLSGDRDRVTRLGQRADKEGVRIHSFAYTPKDIRRPLLLLGELSKKSNGTFRWLRRADSWANAFGQLVDEINRQYVLTYFLGPDENVAGKKLSIKTTGRTVVESANEPKIPTAACGGKPCEGGYCASGKCMVPRPHEGRGIFGWILLIGGILVGAIVALGFVGWLITRRQQAAMPGAMPPGVMPPGAMPPGAMPPGAMPPGATAGPPGSVPPGPPGSMPPGSVPPGSVPPGSVPPGSMPPGKQPKVKKSKAAKQAPAPVATPVAAPTTGPRFYIMTGPRSGETIGLRHGFMIGKAPGCDLLIDDGYTSGQHAQIGMDHFKNCRLYDHNSTNGTYVNGVRITEYVLQHGMTVRIGSTELRFLAE